MPQITIGKGLAFYEEAQALPGVKRVAGMVKQDIELVTGVSPAGITSGQGSGCAVLYGTIGHSPMLDALEAQGKIALNAIRGKWECYSFQVIETPLAGIGAALVIAGNDKRGTIYGLFHLSELIGVSPLVNWNHVLPRHQDTVVLDDRVNMVSRVPSVKYRGFFINDEWPAFGNWAKTHFGSMNAACYAPVFELLLRMKGNYLWPAMWNSNFSLDGPGLENAVLADELGVVMSTSHHEPCMRSGQEYSMVRGRGSIYGDAWDYIANPEGITRFWRDGLTRNKDFENVITLGMRGENDTAIMQHATLEENIQLIRNVLKTQNQLIREIINPDVRQVPRQIVFFSETEEFFYGSKETPGLIGDPELDGVTLMLSDNNHGSTRTLPSPEMRSHPGGYGMYYHMDMHGGPHSFEWVGSTYLPKVWEEMTAAYEYGVREIWVTNIGDIGTQEFGLSYFLDLAYDIDVWGGQDAAITTQYTAQWVRRNFGAVIVKNDVIVSTGYTGAPRGRANCIDIGTCVRQKMGIPRGERYEFCRSVHAEANAIISAQRRDMVGASIYLVGRDARSGELLHDATSCPMCRRMIINAGISQVIIRRDNDTYDTIDVADWVAHDDVLDGQTGY